MTATESYDLADRYLADEGTVFLTGIQALARLPLEQLRADLRAGWNTAAYVTGYPGSPLGGYDGAVAAAAAVAPDLPVVCHPAVNEELAASAVMGCQLASLQPDRHHEGVVGIWYGKGPGVDRASDALRHAVFAGTSSRGGAVALMGDDPEAKSSTIPSSSAGAAADMHMPMLYPGDPSEALDLGRHAIALSRTTGLWVALKIVADVADATASVDLHPHRIDPVIPTIDGERYRHQPDGRLLTPHTLELEEEIIEVRYELATRYASQNRLNHLVADPADAWIGIVASGVTYRELREAFGRLGLHDDAELEAVGIRVLQMGMPFPFDPRTIRRFARDLDEVLVIEEKRPTIESLIKDTLYSLADRPLVVGKLDEAEQRLVPEHGALDADHVVPVLRRRLSDRLGERLTPPGPEPRPRIAISAQRAPYYCSGCPHNRSTRAPEGALIGAGIGCHTMAMLMDPERVGDIAGVTCMGSEGAQWIGMSSFVERQHFIQNVGDGTYFHSAQLAIQAAVAAEANITYKLLYNDAVAMTGGQQPRGQRSIPDVVQVMVAQGVRRIIITTDDVGQYDDVALAGGTEVWPRDRLFDAQSALAETPGVTVLIHDQACAAELRRGRKRGQLPTPTQRVVINHRICEGCGDCGDVSNCLSVQPIETPFGRKTQIDQTTCNYDYTCLEGDCPSFMTVELGQPGRLARWLSRGSDAAASTAPSGIDPGEPPPVADPVVQVDEDDYAVRITGIGGTGVVTVAQVLGTAAMLDGFRVRGLDQTGLSQKAGPVVSDVRLSRQTPISSHRLGEGQADLLLAFDQLVAASVKSLHTCDRAQTAVVGSLSATPTGEMVTHLDVTMPPSDELADRIGDACRPDAQYWADAQAITFDLFGQTTTANMFVVGMAVQSGFLPIDPGRIDEAIALNGVAVDANIAAFGWGRAQIADPDSVRRARGTTPSPAPAPVTSASLATRIAALELDDPAHLERLAAELTAWQHEKTAHRWLTVVERVHQAEQRQTPGHRELTAAVADNLFKLTAYKDEYEVARLMVDSDGLAVAREVAGDQGSIAWKLHPPMLKALGMNDKITIGSWAEPAIRALARGRRLRGSIADPFRWTEVRRLERALPGEYVDAVDRVIGRLTPANHAQAVALAQLPDHVRGYEELKLRRVAEYRDRLAAALAEF